ncbi:unnamed protein product, partial [Prunus brigantina]
ISSPTGNSPGPHSIMIIITQLPSPHSIMIIKALELHPDKRLHDPHTHANFRSLKLSYEMLKDDKARKMFDDLLRDKREQQHHGRHCHLERDAKRQDMVSEQE